MEKKVIVGLLSLSVAILLILGAVFGVFFQEPMLNENVLEDSEYKLIEKSEDMSLNELDLEVVEDYGNHLLVESSSGGNQLAATNEITVLDDELNKVHLRRETIDTNSEGSLQTVSESEDGHYLVQTIGPIISEWRENLEEKGEIIEYIPENTYLMEINGDGLEEIKEKEFVQWTGEYKEEYKIAPELDQAEGELVLSLITHDSAGQLIPELEQFGTILDHGSDRVRIAAESSSIPEIAEIESIGWIEEENEIELLNHDAQWSVQSGESEVRSIWDDGLTGEGQIVGFADTGLDYSHNQFRDPDNHDDFGSTHRKIETYEAYADDFDGHGHGTHVAGSIAGNDEIDSDPQPHDGIAKNARLSVYDIGTPDGSLDVPSDLSLVYDAAYEDGGRLHSNSWGAPDSSYTDNAQQTDEYMWHNDDMLILYAAANDGPDANTVGSPGTAKNILTIGASGVGEREVSQNDMASFSSRGPTDDGRLKPEVVAPGAGGSGWGGDDDIISAEASSDASSPTNSYTDMQGTSMACPVAAGSTALVREYFEDGHYPGDDIAEPSAALLKAVIVNSAEEITGDGAYENSDEFPNNDQGFGRITLENALEFEGDDRNLEVYDEETGLDTGEADTYTVNVEDTSEPFEATMAYTDHPGSTTASTALVNDLNLRVTAPDGSEYKGNVFEGANPGQSTTGGEFDDLNPLENVLRLDPQQGEYEIEVIAENVPEGPQPYALAVTGGLDDEPVPDELEADFTYEQIEPVEEYTIDFTDQSSPGEYDITDWSWDFGDDATSTEENPVHSYSQAGDYDVTLTVTDASGDQDTEVKNVQVEEPAYCEVNGGDTSYDEYITNVQFNGIDRDSGDDGGYADHTDSVSDPVEPGEIYELSVTLSTGGYSNHATVVIDWSQDYDLSNEEVIEIGNGDDDPLTLTTDITVPEDAEEGETRMRVMQEYDEYHYEPCEDQSYGETEDYTVAIEDDPGTPDGPDAVFSYEPSTPETEETVQFTDESVSGDGEIEGWSWEFGDGVTSTEQDPTHAYSEEGTYTVELTVTDDNDLSDTATDTIMVEDVSGEYCEVNGGDTSYGEYITNVQFNGIDRSSNDDGGYADHTDSVSDPVEAGESYELSVTASTGGYTNGLTVVIDWSQDYDLSNEEVIEIGSGDADPLTVTTTITVPEDAEEGETRMRVMQEYDDFHTDPCEDQSYGETEDYTVAIGEDDDDDEPGSYCEVEGGSTQFGEYITNVQFNGIDVDSGDTGGYADYTDHVSDPIIPGEDYLLSVTISTGGYENYVSVVIDWGQNYDLEDEEIYGLGSGSSDLTTLSAYLTVPEDAEPGQTRMRVMQEYNGYHTDPCENQDYGETHDFTVEIADGTTSQYEIVSEPVYEKGHGHLEPIERNGISIEIRMTKPVGTE